MRHQFEQLLHGTLTIIEYKAKFTDLASYAPFLVADEHEKPKPTQSESVTQSSRSTYTARKGQQQIYRKGNSSYQSGQHMSHATTQPQGTTTGTHTQTQTQLARAALQVARGQGRHGVQVAQGTGGPPRFFDMDRQDAETSNAVVTCIITMGSYGAYTLINPGSMYSYVSPSFAINIK
ncbi:uncharacterized protein [Nicotiana tomentosiformis]|uniref:uncharacterized protein n=1 Tax=Nicotiana tomentosiformis TaxID=4098 RepID=UPI00388CCB41